MSHHGHIPSTADHSDDALLAQKIATIIHAYGTDGKYSNRDVHLVLEQVPNVRKVLVLLYANERTNGVLAFEYRFVEGQGVQGESVIHRPSDDQWKGLVESLYPGAHKIVEARHHG